jgi:hypothetical protein
MIITRNRSIAAVLAVSVIATMGSLYAMSTATNAPDAQVGHIVFFSLKDGSEAGRAKLIAACDKYLSGHDGVVYYSAGVIGDDFKRDVNDRDFDVALHVVFANKAAHDKYQVAPRHEEFIKEAKSGWEKVRVFDSYINPIPVTQ